MSGEKLDREIRTCLLAHFELDNFNAVCDDGRFVALVKGGVEHLASIAVEALAEAGPLKVKAVGGRGTWDERPSCDVPLVVPHVLSELGGAGLGPDTVSR